MAEINVGSAPVVATIDPTAQLVLVRESDGTPQRLTGPSLVNFLRNPLVGIVLADDQPDTGVALSLSFVDGSSGVLTLPAGLDRGAILAFKRGAAVFGTDTALFVINTDTSDVYYRGATAYYHISYPDVLEYVTEAPTSANGALFVYDTSNDALYVRQADGSYEEISGGGGDVTKAFVEAGNHFQPHSVSSLAGLNRIVAMQATSDRPAWIEFTRPVQGIVSANPNADFRVGDYAIMAPRTLLLQPIISAQPYLGKVEVTPRNIKVAADLDGTYQVTLSDLDVKRLIDLGANYIEIWFGSEPVEFVANWTPVETDVITVTIDASEETQIGLTNQDNIRVLAVFRHDAGGGQAYIAEIGTILTIGGEETAGAVNYETSVAQVTGDGDAGDRDTVLRGDSQPSLTIGAGLRWRDTDKTILEAIPGRTMELTPSGASNRVLTLDADYATFDVLLASWGVGELTLDTRDLAAAATKEYRSGGSARVTWNRTARTLTLNEDSFTSATLFTVGAGAEGLTPRERAGLMSISISPASVPNATAASIARDYILTITGSDVLPEGTWYRIVIHGENFPRAAWVRSPGVQRLRFSINASQAGRIAAQVAALHDMTVEMQLWDAETSGTHFASRVETVGLSSGDTSGKQDALSTQQLAELIDLRMTPTAIVASEATVKGPWQISSDDPSIVGATVWATPSIAGQSLPRQRLTGSALRFTYADVTARQIANNIVSGQAVLNANVELYDSETGGNLLANLHRDITLLPSGRAEDSTARASAKAAADAAAANKLLIDANAVAIKSNADRLDEGVGIVKRAAALPPPTDANADEVYYIGKTLYINDEVGKAAVFRDINATDLRAVWSNAVTWGGVVGATRGATTNGRVVFVTEATAYPANTWQIANNGGWSMLPTNSAAYNNRWRGRVQDEAHAVDAVDAVNQWVSWGSLMQVTTSVTAATHREWHRYERNEVQKISVASLATSVIPVNVDLGSTIEITLDRDINLSLSGGNDGDSAVVYGIQDATGSHGISYRGSSLDLSTAGGTIDAVAFVRRGGVWQHFGAVVKGAVT